MLENPNGNMMSYYVLTTPLEDQLGLMPSVHLNMNYDKWKILEKQFTKTQFYEDEKQINFILNEREGIPNRVVDVMKWYGHQVPTAKFQYLVLSSKFKQIIELFRLPKHVFYEADIYIESEKTIYPFFVFHFHFDYIYGIQLEETIFEERHFRASSNIKSILRKGTIRTPEEFYPFAEENAAITYWFYPDKLRFKSDVYLDLFATEDGIIVSEPLKEAIEKANMTGIELTEYTRYEIIMGQK